MNRRYLLILVCLFLILGGSCSSQNDKDAEDVATPAKYIYHPDWCSVGSFPSEREDGQYWGISILDYDKEWYVEEPQKHVVIPVYDVPKDQTEYVVKFPKTYEAEVNGMYYEINFFQEYYGYNDLIQVHIKMTNRLGCDVEYHSAQKKIRFENENIGYSIYPSHYRDRDCISHTTDPDILVLKDGASLECEEILVCDPRVFVPGDTITCIISPQFFEKWNEPGVLIPVEVVKAD